MTWQFPWRRREEDQPQPPQPVGPYWHEPSMTWRDFESDKRERTRISSLEARLAETEAQRHQPATDGFERRAHSFDAANLAKADA